MHDQPTSGLPPSLRISNRDATRLEALLDAPQWREHPAADALMAELSRAEIIDDDAMPTDVVGMHSRVECVDDASGERHSITPVYPHEADIDAGRVSILAPVASALLGLSPGQSIDWTLPGGRTLQLRVLDVSPG
ncbi:nucleoside diphosphate kinase regulator [Luteimonas aestuarii]|uniref:Nucleoside diphosphate kinase regulator n=1 Tax=Luteimonas aestuarii TaxID=453837 RepID=A0A4R5TLA8_9GAMM|nr:nucleoside diphosphate kinase regulator [Luteimonas aestuarii]TDK21732.1 nucleoside diphosphate kinase regulator [Luteimonas aestuarii]